jgi:hypothetical protein
MSELGMSVSILIPLSGQNADSPPMIACKRDGVRDTAL